MATDDSNPSLGSDVLSTVGLVLNFGAVISLALWLSMAGSHSGSGLRVIPGILTIVLFGGSIFCFAVEQNSTRSESGGFPAGLPTAGHAESPRLV